MADDASGGEPPVPSCPLGRLDEPPIHLDELEVVHAGEFVVFDGSADGERLRSNDYEWLACKR